MTTPQERAEAGRAVRKAVPRSSFGEWHPAADRPDPVKTVFAQDVSRLPDLVPERHARMGVSAFTFLRGAAAVMATDLGARPNTGLTVQLCGDAHLLNFGVFASPERTLVFDVNDFDETLPGPFEWDVQRLVASIAVAVEDNSWGRKEARRAARLAAKSYRETVTRLAGMGDLDVWYEKIDADEAISLLPTAAQRRRGEKLLAKARTRTSLQAMERLTEVVGDVRQFRYDPPVLEPAAKDAVALTRQNFEDYRSTLQDDRRHLLDRFTFVAAARKVVGVGSVGTRCYVVLLQGRDADDPLILQIKEADVSALEAVLPASSFDNHGHRVVTGQRLMQAASDIFLGWAPGRDGNDYFWRQLRDQKGAVDTARMIPDGVRRYGQLCASVLARAHARTGDRIAIAAYLGTGTVFDESMADFALAYLDQNAKDFAAFSAQTTPTP